MGEKIGLKDWVRQMDDKSKQIWDRCEDLLTACKLIGVYIVGMQSRLELGFPIDEDVRIMEDELITIVKGVEDLKKDLEDIG